MLPQDHFDRLPARTLLVADGRSELAAFRAALATPAGALDRRIHLTTVRGEIEGTARIAEGGLDLVILELPIRAAHPRDTLARVRAAGDVPILALAHSAEVGEQAVLAGACDWVPRDPCDADTLRRAIRYALERGRMREAMRLMSFTDELTGLLNRRGFFEHAGRQMKALRRSRGAWLLHADVDGLRRVNERFGMDAGNRVLLATADALRAAVRGSDILARTGGDEFTALLVDAAREASRAVLDRLTSRLAASPDRHIRAAGISLTVGSVRCEPESAYTLDQLMQRADDDMHARKKGGG
jgi:diguanylate cyclase (GGDEF)-like protein